MGAGSTALIWYGLCCCGVAFTVIVASGLVAYGNRAEARKRREALSVRSIASEGRSGDPNVSDADASEDGRGDAS